MGGRAPVLIFFGPLPISLCMYMDWRLHNAIFLSLGLSSLAFSFLVMDVGCIRVVFGTDIVDGSTCRGGPAFAHNESRVRQAAMVGCISVTFPNLLS